MEENKQDGLKPKKKRGKRLAVLLLSLVIFVACVLGVLQLGCVYTGAGWSYFYPDYEKLDLRPILEKYELTEEDYETLYRQTGLTKLGIDGYQERNETDRILATQEFFFEKQEVTSDHFAPFTYTEKIDGVAPMAPLEDGDIIVTSTTRVSWWRYGHAALVINGKNGSIVESIAPGTSSAINHAYSFADLGDFLILRPKADEETKSQVVEFAKEKLVDVPYRLTVGVFSKKFNEEEISYSQCAHLVWYAYKKFGIDLDSTGGGVVKPQDIARSDQVEVVQAYGFDLDKLWS